MGKTDKEKEDFYIIQCNTFLVLEWISRDAVNAQQEQKNIELIEVSNTDLMALYTSFLWFLRNGDDHVTAREHLNAAYRILSCIKNAQKSFSPYSGPSFLRRDALWILLTGFLVFLLANVKKGTIILKDFDGNITEELLESVIALMPNEWISNVCAIKAGERGVLRTSYRISQTSHRKN